MSTTGEDVLVQNSREVMLWLKTIYTDVPPFEVNEFTIGKLYSIKKACDESARNISLVVNDLERKRKEYEAEAKRLKVVSEHVGVAPEGLSIKGQTALRNLASAACTLELRRPSESSFLLALTDITRDRFKVRSERTKEKRRAEKLAETTVQTIQKIHQFQKLLPIVSEEREIQEKQCRKLEKDANFLKSKIKNYNFDIIQLEEKYQQSGMEDRLSHKALQTKIESIQKSKSQLSSLHSRLKSYKDLPPSEEMARLKIEEVKEELEEIEKQILQHMSQH